MDDLIKNVVETYVIYGIFLFEITRENTGYDTAHF